jgi:hypothetical protein
MDLIEWDDYSRDEFCEDVFDSENYNMNRCNLNRYKYDRYNQNRSKKHIYECIPEYECHDSPDFDCCDVEDYPLCRKPLNEITILGYPACFNRSFRVVERRLFYYYW